MESFDYEQVKTKLSSLGTVFDDFVKKLTEMDTKLNNNVNVGESGAFQGVVAKALLESWNNCSDKFITFKEEFDILLNSVMQVSDNNVSLEDEVMAMYGSSPSSTTPTTASVYGGASTTVGGCGGTRPTTVTGCGGTRPTTVTGCGGTRATTVTGCGGGASRGPSIGGPSSNVTYQIK